ncbi:MAG: hypothetical protein WDO72_01025 [Pseudomonadota bacterium]
MKKIHITRLVAAAGITGALTIASPAMADEQKPATQQVVVKFITATPEQIARHGGDSTQSGAGMRAYIDADTKQLRAATQAELNESAARPAAPAAAKRSAGVATAAVKTGPAVEKLANGVKKVSLDDAYLSYAVATVGPDGKVKQACVDQQPNQQAALAVAAKAGADSHEK